MAKPSAIDQLNPDDKFWLDTWFKDKGFCGYVEIAEILMERGYSISKSSVHRYGQNLYQIFAAIKKYKRSLLRFKPLPKLLY